MKSKQLRGIIREELLEVLNEIGQTPGHGAVKVKKVVHVYNKKTSEHKYYGSLVAAKKGENPFHFIPSVASKAKFGKTRNI